ncbi:MAG: tetratricopeptide repeat protein [Candidatus Nitrosopolaris sp.]
MNTSSSRGDKQTSSQLQEERQANYAYNKGIALAQSGKILEAIKYYDKALATQPINSDLLMSKGDLF